MRAKVVLIILILGTVATRFHGDDFNYIDEKVTIASLLKEKKFDEAVQAYVTLSERDDITDYQKSDALCLAADCALFRMRDSGKALELAERIPLEDFKAWKMMRILAKDRKEAEIVERYGAVDFSTFRPVVRGDCHQFRAGAYEKKRMPQEAKKDYQEALKWASGKDRRVVGSITLALAKAHLACGEQDEAVGLYRKLVENENAFFRDRKQAWEALTKLGIEVEEPVERVKNKKARKAKKNKKKKKKGEKAEKAEKATNE